MYNMSVTSFGFLIELLLCIRGCSAAVPIVNCPSGNVNVGSTVVLTCTINPAEAMTWKRDTHSLANCDTFVCAVISSPGRYTFTTDIGGQTVNMTIAPVEPDDDNKEFKCVTTSSDSCNFSVSSTTMASTTGPPATIDDSGLTTGHKIGIGLVVACVVAIEVVFVIIVIARKHKEQWRREFKLVHELKELKYLKESLGENASGGETSYELVCVIEVYSTANIYETLSAQETKTLASKLESVLEPYLYEAVTINKIGFTTKLPCRSLTELLTVIELIRGDEWNKFLREMENNHQDTKLRTQVDADSFRACVTYIKDIWRREFKLDHELNQLNGLKESLGGNANDEEAPYELVCVIEVYSTANRYETLSAQEKKILASKLDSVLEPYLYEAVTINKYGYTTKLPCRSLTALLNVIYLIRGDEWNKFLREMEKKLQNTKLRTRMDADSFRDCVTYFNDLQKTNHSERTTAKIPSVVHTSDTSKLKKSLLLPT